MIDTLRFHKQPLAFFNREGWQPAVFIAAAAFLGLLISFLPLMWVVGLVVGAGLLLLIVIQPLFGVGLTLLAGPFGALEKVIWDGGWLDSGQFLLLATVAAWIARGCIRRQIRLPRTFLTVPWLLFLFAGGVTLFTAVSLTFGLRELLKWVQIGLVMMVVVDLGQTSPTLRGRPTWQWVALMLLLAGVSQALIGIWQFGLRGDGPEHFQILGSYYRAYGTFEQPNPYGGYLNLTALLALGMAVGLLATAWQPPRLRWRSLWRPLPLFVLFTAVITSLALILSWSRGAWLGFVAGGVTLAFFLPRKRWVGLTFLIVGLAFFVVSTQLQLVPASIMDRLTGFQADLQFGDVRGVDINDANYAVLERLAHWQAAVNMARDHFWMGVGLGNYEPAYAQYALINWPDALGHAHNYYLNILAETGILGTAAYLLFWTAVLWQNLRLLRRSSWLERGIALGMLAAFIALSVHHLVDKLYVNNIYIHLGVMFGLVQLIATNEKQGT